MGKRAALVNASKGISHFALIDLLEEDIAVTIQQYEYLHRVTAVSATWVRIERVKVTAQTPALAE